MGEYPRIARIREQVANNTVDSVWARADLDYLLEELDIAKAKIAYLLTISESPDMDTEALRKHLDEIEWQHPVQSTRRGIAGALAYEFDIARATLTPPAADERAHDGE